MREIDKVLEEGERVLWEGKPESAPFIAPRVLASLIIGVFFIGFFILPIISLTMAGVLSDDFRLLPIFAIILFLFIDIYIVNLIHKKRFFGLTNKRIIVQSGVIGRDFRMVDLDRISNVDVKVNAFDKIFGDDSGSIYIYTAGTPGGTSSPITISNISDPYDLYKMINRTEYDVKRDTYYPNRMRRRKENQ